MRSAGGKASTTDQSRHHNLAGRSEGRWRVRLPEPIILVQGVSERLRQIAAILTANPSLCVAGTAKVQKLTSITGKDLSTQPAKLLCKRVFGGPGLAASIS
jgi:hypothetical protein